MAYWKNKLIGFIKRELWRTKLDKMPRWKRYIFRLLRVSIIAFREFQKDECTTRASALTYFSVLSIVPILALAFGIAQGFGLDSYLRNELILLFTGQEEIMNQSIIFAEKMIDNTNGGLIAGLGFLILIYTVIRLMGSIEHSFNVIWNIEKPRTWIRKFSDFTAMMVISPVMVISASSINVFITTEMKYLARNTNITFINELVAISARLLPFALISIMLTLFYVIMPNIRVKSQAAIVAGFLSGAAFHILQWAYINFQLGLSNYNTVYGSFAALPLFLVWLQFSWMIVLFGAVLAFAYQTSKEYLLDYEELKMSHVQKRKLSLLVMHYIAIHYVKGNTQLTALKISDGIGVPLRFVINILKELTYCQLLIEVDQRKDYTYLPAIDVHQLTVDTLFQMMEKKGMDTVEITETQLHDQVEKIMNDLHDSRKLSNGNVSILFWNQVYPSTT